MSSVRILVVLMVVCILAGSLVQQAEACRCDHICGGFGECYVASCGPFGWVCCPWGHPACNRV
ncbi:hypothetical protein DPMN_082009 [Dreissena polymorpha]|uniref:Uncharacterized protein n=1 Tax=Dreissena polymorpha TaxID=45954 RepID=A0A9D4BGG1_DREPO|nr:hypothetical protein DPMN_082009 [Dreissena polymorpha]